MGKIVVEMFTAVLITPNLVSTVSVSLPEPTDMRNTNVNVNVKVKVKVIMTHC